MASKNETGGAGKVTGYPAVKQSEAHASPRHVEDGGKGSSGAGTPVSDRAASVSAHFSVGKSSADQGSSIKGAESVDLESGQATYRSGAPHKS